MPARPAALAKCHGPGSAAAAAGACAAEALCRSCGDEALRALPAGRLPVLCMPGASGGRFPRMRAAA